MSKSLPVYEFTIDDSDIAGVKTVSIVSDPAFGSSAVYFSKQKPKFITLGDVKKQIVAGLSLIPNVLIYRVDPETGLEYNGFFSAETIEKIVDKYHKEMLTNQVNLEHNPKAYIDAYLLEDYIVNSDARVEDLKLKGIEHENIMGSWYTSFKIENTEVFDKIMNSGDATGFSVESFLDKELVQFKNNIITSKLKSEMKKINKSLKDKILAIFTDIEKFERVLVPELAFEIEYTEVGQPVNKIIVDENGVETMELVGKGEFVTENGIIVTDEASNLVEIRELLVEPAPEVEVEVEPMAVSGVTGTTGQTKMRGIDTPINALVDLTKDGMYLIDVLVEGGLIKDAVMNTQSTLLSKQYNFGDMEKRLKELIPSDKQGSYTINVDVNSDGEYVWGSISSWTSLKFHSESELEALKATIVKLEADMKAPITDPILTPETPAVDYSKLSAYEKLMHNKGLVPFQSSLKK